MKHRKHLSAGVVVSLCALAPALADVPIDPSATGSRQIVLDHDQDTGNYFAVVRGVEPQFDFWRLYLSTDRGANWGWIFGFTTAGDWADVDLAVAGDYVYVGFHRLGAGEARIARFFATDGSWDSVYGTRTLVDVSPSVVVDIALASDQDGADNEIYYALIASDGSLRFFFDSSADGTTFAELSPGISDATSGLDMTFNPGSPDHLILFSYWDSSSVINVWRSFPWEKALSLFFSQPIATRSAISAYGDAVIVCLGQQIPDGTRVLDFRSYSAGDDWRLETLDAPTPGEGDYIGCDVTARGGRGFAAAYMHEEGAFDPVYLRRNTGGDSAPWEERVVINETDVAVASIFRTSLNWFPPGYYGIAYIEDSQGTPYFDILSIFSDGFELGDTSAWSGSVP